MIPDESKKPNKQINIALFLISETALKYSVLPTNFNLKILVVSQIWALLAIVLLLKNKLKFHLIVEIK